MRNDTVSMQGLDNWKEPFWFDKWHPREDNPATSSDATPYKYVTITDDLADLDVHMVVDALEVKRMRMSDLDITLWCDRGAGRAQLIVYRRRQAQLNKRTADSLRILRVVMGKMLVGFLLWNCYEFCPGIPFCVMTAMARGNGCFQKDPDNDRWCSHRWKPDDRLTPHIQHFRKEKQMIDLCELIYFGNYSVEYGQVEDSNLWEMEQENV